MKEGRKGGKDRKGGGEERKGEIVEIKRKEMRGRKWRKVRNDGNNGEQETK